MTATMLALMAALLEAMTCPRPIPGTKLHKMVRWAIHAQHLDTAPDTFLTRELILATGRHAASYACRKKVPGKPRLSSPVDAIG